MRYRNDVEDVRQPVANELAETAAHCLRVLVADKAKADLRVRLGRDHGLEALTDVAAPDTVDLGCRA